MNTILALVVALVLPLLPAVAQDVAVAALASLTDPQKLATLKGDRAANDRLLKCVYWLHDARGRGQLPERVIDAAQKLTGDPAAHAALVREGLLRNLTISDRLGLLTPENAEGMRRGRSPIVMHGPYAGEKAEVDHIVPVIVAPQLCNELANLELMPRTLNRRKGAKMGQRQRDYARRFNAAGMLSDSMARALAL